jgi:hypothetical protein
MPEDTDAPAPTDDETDRTNATETTTDPRDDADTGTGPGDDADTAAVPGDVVADAERLTRLAREAVDHDEAAAYRTDRDDRLGEYDYTARVREDDTGETLVCHPDEWVEDGTIRPDRIDDTSRAIEVALSGTGDPDEWDDIDAHNRDLVERVRDDHGDVHAANVSVLADFAGNHYAKPIDDLTAPELREFENEYVVRNAWLDDDQAAVLEESVHYAFDVAKERVPDW